MNYEWYCGTLKFVINGVDAHWSDFGDKRDACTSSATEYGCGDMQFTPQPCTDVVLKKYGITADEYNEIAEMLRDELSFGRCGLCC